MLIRVTNWIIPWRLEHVEATGHKIVVLCEEVGCRKHSSLQPVGKRIPIIYNPQMKKIISIMIVLFECITLIKTL